MVNRPARHCSQALLASAASSHWGTRSSHEHQASLVRWRFPSGDPRSPACFCLCQSKFLNCIWSLVTNPGKGLLGVGGFHLLGHKTGFAEARGLAGYLPRLPSQSWSEWGLFWAQRWGSCQDVLGVKPHSPAVPTWQPLCCWLLALCNPSPSGLVPPKCDLSSQASLSH